MKLNSMASYLVVPLSEHWSDKCRMSLPNDELECLISIAQIFAPQQLLATVSMLTEWLGIRG